MILGLSGVGVVLNMTCFSGCIKIGEEEISGG